MKKKTTKKAKIENKIIQNTSIPGITTINTKLVKY